MAIKKNNPEVIEDKVPGLLSKRWLLAYVCSSGLTALGLLRLNMSVAIVCMVVDPSGDDDVTSGNWNNGDAHNNASSFNVSGNVHGRLGEFHWDKSVQSAILSSYYYGYTLVQIPSSWLATKFGVKHTMGWAVSISALANILIPLAARWDYKSVMFLRFVIGIGTGTMYPCVQTMWPFWAPFEERSRLLAFSYMGGSVGEMASFAISGLLCAYGFDNGWGSIFYITGGMTFLWCLAWFYLVSDTPDSHPTISRAERLYITQNSIKIDQRKLCIPWRDIAKSRGVWANLIGQFCHLWLYTTFITFLPTFMNEVLDYDIRQNGLLSSLPYICTAVFALVAGHVADVLRTNYLSTTCTRRLLQTVDFSIAGACILSAGYLDRGNRIGTVILLTLGIGTEGIGFAALFANTLDFALRYVGIVFAIINTVANVSGMIVPIVTGALTPDSTARQWRHVFYICGGMALLGIVAFGGFAVGEPEEWALRGDEDLLLDVKSKTSYGDSCESLGDGGQTKEGTEKK